MTTACKQCTTIILDDRKTFCNQSCAATFNNKGRVLSDKSKAKIKAGVEKKLLARGEALRPYLACQTCTKEYKQATDGQLHCSRECARVTHYIDRGIEKPTVGVSYARPYSENVANFRRRQKHKAVEYKGGACAWCGYCRYVGALDFHHVDPSKKDFAISHCHTRSWEKMRAR